MRRKIFPTLLNASERRSLAKLSAKTRCSQSAVIRRLITNEAPLAELCRDLIVQLLQDKTYRHRASTPGSQGQVLFLVSRVINESTESTRLNRFLSIWSDSNVPGR